MAVPVARIVPVNTGRGKQASWAGELKRTAIDKRRAVGPVQVCQLAAEWLGTATG